MDSNAKGPPKLNLRVLTRVSRPRHLGPAGKLTARPIVVWAFSKQAATVSTAGARCLHTRAPGKCWKGTEAEAEKLQSRHPSLSFPVQALERNYGLNLGAAFVNVALAKHPAASSAVPPEISCFQEN